MLDFFSRIAGMPINQEQSLRLTVPLSGSSLKIATNLAYNVWSLFSDPITVNENLLSLWIKLNADAVGRMSINSVQGLQVRPATVGDKLIK